MREVRCTMKQNIYDNPEFFESYHQLRASKITYNDFVEQPALKSLLPDLSGKRVLDLGCGYGEMAHYCISHHADHVTGVDISEKMLALAEKHSNITFIHSAMEDLQFEQGEFDLIISSLAFHYVKDLDELMGRIASWLKPEGQLIFSTEHPVVLASKAQAKWITNEQGENLYWTLDNYKEEGERSQFWKVDGVIKYHRTLSTLINVQIAHGLCIEQVLEPESIPEGIEKKPKLVSEVRRPSFILFRARKG